MTESPRAALAGLILDAAQQLAPGADLAIELPGNEGVRVSYLSGKLWVWRRGCLLFSGDSSRGEAGPLAAQLLTHAERAELLADEQATAEREARKLVEGVGCGAPSLVSNGGR